MTKGRHFIDQGKQHKKLGCLQAIIDQTLGINYGVEIMA